tara:strand:- start:6384 stop:7484 length:1101 start_codon:yes stop_codon:yes gene_type:complete
MTKLVFWTSDLINLINYKVQNSKPRVRDVWNLKQKIEKQYILRSGHKPFGHSVVIDRAKENTFSFKSKNILGWLPLQKYTNKKFDECMFETANLLASKGKTIDLFWSGGVDSNATLLAFNELGLQKQLHIIIGGKIESPELFKKIIKGRIDYTWVDSGVLNELTEVADPSKHILCSLAEVDPMFGCKSTTAGKGIVPKSLFDCWETKRRYFSSHNTWRWALNFKGDKVDLDNYMPFIMQKPLEKWLCNHALNGDMVYYDLTHEGWGDWYETGEALDAPSQKYYQKCKMPLRDFTFKITKDRELSYNKPKVLSGVRLTTTKNKFRVIAITEFGDIITKDNILDYDWLSFLDLEIKKPKYKITELNYE